MVHYPLTETSGTTIFNSGTLGADVDGTMSGSILNTTYKGRSGIDFQDSLRSVATTSNFPTGDLDFTFSGWIRVPSVIPWDIL